MLRMLAVILIPFLFAGNVASETQADIVDQQQLNITSSMSSSDGVFYNVQSFQQTNSTITGASVAIRNVPVGTPITIRLYDVFTDTSNPSLAIAQGSVVTTTTSPTVSQFETVSFGGPIVVTPNSPLFLTFEKATGPSNTVQGEQGLGGFMGSSGNPYPDGQLFNANNEFPLLDFAFETFAVDPNAVPEPSSMALIGFGFAAAALARRRR